MLALLSLPLLLLAGTQYSKGQDDWDYTFNGNDWTGTCKTGKHQSPIDINTKWTNDKFHSTPLQFINYDQTVPVRIEMVHHTICCHRCGRGGGVIVLNTGFVRCCNASKNLMSPAHRRHTKQRVQVSVLQHLERVMVYPKEGVRIAISGGGLRGTYVLQQAHFHWGAEHLINSQRYAMEAHLVHFRDVYGNRSEPAQQDPEGIAVLGVLFCLGPSSFNIERVLEGFTEEVELNFYDFLPTDLDFYRYQGSLTTPPCSEAVVWTVFKNRTTLSKSQLERIKNSLPEGSHSNYRNVQALNRREVEKWEVRGKNENKVGGLKSSPNLLVAAPLLARNVYGIF